ncbi:hypothetical protein GGI43DRAFT_49798 [Trichoderma evansii]
MAFNIDDASLRLCIQLQSQDAIALIKGKHRDDEQPPDIEFAAELYKFELQSLQMFYYDRALCRTLDGLDLDAGDLLRGRADEEQPATSEPGNIFDDKAAPTQSSMSSPSGTVFNVNTVNEETTEQSDDEVASTTSSMSYTTDASSSISIVDDETTEPLAAP